MSQGERTPRNMGYYMPAEWEPHEGTWLQWPKNKIYSRYELKQEGPWLNMVDALNEHENVHLVYLAAVNRVGLEQAPRGSGSIQCWGGSFTADLSGQVIRKASMEAAENLLCSVDLERIERVRNISSYPFRDRRVDSYHDLTKLYSS
jgi:hypothetical protein